MSGIYIPNMEMPKNCLACDWCAHTIPADNYICYRLNRAVIGVAEEDVNETVNACCPLVPVPSHGRCIDADALTEKLKKHREYHLDGSSSGAAISNGIGQCLDIINGKECTTIIPAEGGET